MTQDEYKLWTGEDASSYTNDEWTKILTVAKLRLASFLCLSELPTDDDGNLPADLEQLLANFIAEVIAHQGSTGAVESKHVRNFTIEFASTTAANAFAKIAAQYGDIIEAYSNCELGFAVERNAHYFCGSYDGGIYCGDCNA